MSVKLEPVKQQRMEEEEIDLLELANFYLSKVVYVIIWELHFLQTMKC